MVSVLLKIVYAFLFPLILAGCFSDPTTYFYNKESKDYFDHQIIPSKYAIGDSIFLIDISEVDRGVFGVRVSAFGDSDGTELMIVKYSLSANGAVLIEQDIEQSIHIENQAKGSVFKFTGTTYLGSFNIKELVEDHNIPKSAKILLDVLFEHDGEGTAFGYVVSPGEVKFWKFPT